MIERLSEGLRRLLRAFFELLYGRLAGLYDPVAWLVSRGAWPAWVQSAMPFLAGEVLEIGPGTGHLLAALAAAGQPAVGLDRSAPLLGRARARLRWADRTGSGSARLVRGEAAALPFGDGRFDRVVTTFPAPFVADPAVMGEIRRVLANGGEWVIVDGARPSGLDPWSRAARWLLAHVARPADAAQAGLVGRLQDAGFAVDARPVAVGADVVTVLRARTRP